MKSVFRCAASKPMLIKPEPLQSKNDPQESNVAGKVRSKPPNKPAQKILSQAFHTQQSMRHRKLVMEVPKPPASVPPKSVPGTYKGRVVKSKIDCFRKPVTGDEKTNLSRPNPEVRTSSKVHSKSVAIVPGSSKARLPPYLAGRVKSGSNVPQKAVMQTNGPGQLAPKSVTTFLKPPTRGQAASMRSVTAPTRPPTASSRPVPVPTRTTTTSKPTSFIKKNEPPVQNKPRTAAHKPAVSTSSQYRIRAESAEERR